LYYHLYLVYHQSEQASDGFIQERQTDNYLYFLLQRIDFDPIGQFDNHDYMGIVGGAIHDGFNLGNNGDPRLPLKVTAYKGEKGLVFRIEDAGDGFDFASTFDELQRKSTAGGESWEETCHEENQRFLTLLFARDSKKFTVHYVEPGNVVDIMYLF